MANENTPEYIKALYEHATNVHRGADLIYTRQLLEKLVALADPFYTPFALALLLQTYRGMGRTDLVKVTLERITQLPGDQQDLLNPRWVAACFQKVGDFKRAKEILTEARQFVQNDPYVMAGLAEIAVLEGQLQEALALSEPLRNAPDPAFQVLGRMLSAASHLLMAKEHDADVELAWVAGFLITSGSIPQSTWDYSDLLDLMARIPGKVSYRATLIIQTLTGAAPIASLSQESGQLPETLQTAPKS